MRGNSVLRTFMVQMPSGIFHTEAVDNCEDRQAGMETLIAVAVACMASFDRALHTIYQKHRYTHMQMSFCRYQLPSARITERSRRLGTSRGFTHSATRCRKNERVQSVWKARVKKKKRRRTTNGAGEGFGWTGGRNPFVWQSVRKVRWEKPKINICVGGLSVVYVSASSSGSFSFFTGEEWQRVEGGTVYTVVCFFRNTSQRPTPRP